MPLELHPGLQANLQRLIEPVLANANIDAGGTVSYRPFTALMDSDSALRSLKGEILGEVRAWLGNSPLLAFVYSRVHEEVEAIPLEKRCIKDAPLSSLPGFEDLTAKARQLVVELMALPNEYVVSFHMPAHISATSLRQGHGPIVGDSIAIAGSWHGEHSSLFPPVSPTEGNRLERRAFLSGPIRATLRDQYPVPERQELPSLAVQIRVSGLINPLVGEPVRRAQSEFKSMIGLARVTNVLDDRVGPPRGHEATYPARVHRVVDGKWVCLEDSYQSSERVSEYLVRLRINEPETTGLAEGLEPLVRLFGNPSASGSLKLAGRWIFDAFANDDPVMRFMQFAIAMEVLLKSDAGDAGLTKALANRCAYLIATSAHERDAIRDLISDKPQPHE